MKRYHPVVPSGMPRFYGGAVGYIGYDTIRFFERLPEYSQDSLGIWDIYLVIFDSLVVFDNVGHRIKIVSSSYLPNYGSLKEAYDDACQRIEQINKKLQSPTVPGLQEVHHSLKKLRVRSNVTRQGYLKGVRQAKRYIQKGDIIQVVLSQRLWVEEQLNPFALYRSLRLINPSPYMFFLQYPEYALIGSSPEVLVRLEGSDVEVRPIAGTRPRGRDPMEDRRLETSLKNDTKEKAEHIMLVDLGRNDIGRVASKGSVKVDELMKVERYSHVMHLVSTVKGTLAKGKDCFDAFRACFPAGTLSGAPKIRAMEIIEELEPHRRGPYGGAVGYFSFTGNMDTAIAIRTVLAISERLYFQVGAGIVADSRPEREYEECLNKARAMIKAIQVARKGLIMEERWEKDVVYDLDDR
jgi:anthranilate synthase component 1